MKKKILTKHILMALALAAMVPAGQAWAEDLNITLPGENRFGDKQVDLVEGKYIYQSSIWGSDKKEYTLSDYNNVIIKRNTTEGSQREFATVIDQTYGPQNDLAGTNFYVTVNKGGTNADGLHITGKLEDEGYIDIGDFSGAIHAANSDGISIGNEAGGSNKLNVGSIGQNDINGDRIADGLIVDNGNGIRASAVSDKYVSDKTFTGYESVINVAGATNITIQGGKVTATVDVSNYIPSSLKLFGVVKSATASASYTPAAVYAGNDMYYFDAQWSDWADKYHLLDKVPADLQGIVNDAIQTMKDKYPTMGNDSIGTGIINLHDTNLTLKGEGYGILAGKNGQISVAGNLTINAEGDNSYGIAVKNGNLIYGDGKKEVIATAYPGWPLGSYQKDPISVTITDLNADKSANNGTSVTLGEGKDVSISMQGDNSYAMYAEGVDDTEDNNANSITGKELNTLYAVGDMLVKNGGLIDLGTTGEKTDNNGNSWGAYQLGAVIASGTTNKVSDTDIKKSTYSLSSANANYISSESVIDHAGDLGENAPKINSALYAEHGGQIDLGGSFNYIAADYSGEGSENYSRRAVWAYDTADINFSGVVNIASDDYEQDDPTGMYCRYIVIVSVSSTNVSSGNVNNKISDRATVTVNYDSYADSDGNTVASSIKGDIVSAYAGQVDIRKTDDNAKINITGNLLAGNNGILNVDLGNGGTLTGRADDYGDAGVIDGSGHGTSFFDPTFSSSILKGGVVNLTMGAGSTWNVTGQSWITSIDTRNAAKTGEVLKAEDPIKAMKNMATIDLVSANTDQNQYAHALTIYKMNGDAVFNMSLAGNRRYSDMLYMKKAKGEYIVNLKEAVGVDDMFASMGSDGKTFTGLRFATVGADSDVSFHVFAKDTGMQNIEYTVEKDKYKENEENAAYDSIDGTGAANEQKPGTNMVEGFFNSKGTPPTDSGEESANGQIMLLAAGDEAAGTSTATTETTNFKLTGIKGTELSDAGKTVVNMSKVNYSNAVYMDRLNKRMGEARYIDGDDGLWVRMRHDRIGKDNAFRSMNTMMELGYDRKVQSQKNGEHRWGVAFDYMRGTADYTNVMGSGDVRRAGVWLYDTWLGDKGHYTDYVVKYGHLSNDFDIYAQSSGNKISGDYNNDVWSASAEYGRKKDIGNEWYFEPQAQMQYAYVTSADYTTSQGTKVELDSIDSLIGRVGFRLGRDTDEANTVYFKADVLHEFLGGQSIRAMDTTTNGVLTTTYENEGTWYDVGFGFSHRMSKDKYMFLDVEKLFGNDNEDTYQVNIGLNMAF